MSQVVLLTHTPSDLTLSLVASVATICGGLCAVRVRNGKLGRVYYGSGNLCSWDLPIDGATISVEFTNSTSAERYYRKCKKYKRLLGRAIYRP